MNISPPLQGATKQNTQGMPILVKSSIFPLITSSLCLMSLAFVLAFLISILDAVTTILVVELLIVFAVEICKSVA